MESQVKIIKEKISQLRLSNLVQVGLINMQVTNLLSGLAHTTFYSPMTFDPFQNNPNVTLVTAKNPNEKHKKHKFASVDVIYLGNCKDLFETKLGISYWGPKVRNNGYLFIGANNEEICLAVEQYIEVIGSKFFTLELFEDLVAIKIKR